ncbi:hypothetical protein KAR91_22215 [Candidatus Pacearchaeota archaeon]|nr:hypothetical protein [Candidatus Pacearchaeota archaeon]
MSNNAGVSLLLTVPEEVKDLLYIIAARRVLKNPKDRSTGSGIARDIIVEHINDVVEKEK